MCVCARVCACAREYKRDSRVHSAARAIPVISFRFVFYSQINRTRSTLAVGNGVLARPLIALPAANSSSPVYPPSQKYSGTVIGSDSKSYTPQVRY